MGSNLPTMRSQQEWLRLICVGLLCCCSCDGLTVSNETLTQNPPKPANCPNPVSPYPDYPCMETCNPSVEKGPNAHYYQNAGATSSWDRYDEKGNFKNIDSARNCQQLCADTQGCAFFTWWGSDVHRFQCTLVGADAMLSAPFNPNLLAVTVHGP